MAVTFSAIDLSTRMEVNDLLARFCHALDYNKAREWAELYRPETTIEAPRFGTFRGKDSIAAIPGLVAAEGGGAWRHAFNNVVIDACTDRKNLSLSAYCVVNDWRKGSLAVRCWDFSVVLVRIRSLQIAEVKMCSVGNMQSIMPLSESSAGDDL